MAKPKFFGRVLNPILNTILKSPLHSLLSEHSLVIRYTDREFGKESSFPAYYVQDGNSLYVLIDKSEECWRSLKNGANVKITVRGTEQRGWAEKFRDDDTVIKSFISLLKAVPELLTELDISKDASGAYSKDDMLRALEQHYLLKIDFQSGLK